MSPRLSEKSSSLMPPRPCIRLLPAKNQMRVLCASWVIVEESCASLMRFIADGFCFQCNTVLFLFSSYLCVLKVWVPEARQICFVCFVLLALRRVSHVTRPALCWCVPFLPVACVLFVHVCHVVLCMCGMFLCTLLV